MLSSLRRGKSTAQQLRIHCRPRQDLRTLTSRSTPPSQQLRLPVASQPFTSRPSNQLFRTTSSSFPSRKWSALQSGGLRLPLHQHQPRAFGTQKPPSILDPVQDPSLDTDPDEVAQEKHIQMLMQAEYDSRDDVELNEDEADPELQRRSAELLQELSPGDLWFQGSLADRLLLDFPMQKFLDFDVAKVREVMEKTREHDYDFLEAILNTAVAEERPVPLKFWTFLFFCVKNHPNPDRELWDRYLALTLKHKVVSDRVVTMNLLEAFAEFEDLPSFMKTWNAFLHHLRKLPAHAAFTMCTMFLRGLQFIGTMDELDMVYTVIDLFERQRFSNELFHNAPMDRLRLNKAAEALQKVREPGGSPLPTVQVSSADSLSFWYAMRCLYRCGSTTHAAGYFIRMATYYPERISRRMVSWFLKSAVDEDSSQGAPLFDILRRHFPAQANSPHVYSIMMGCYSNNAPAQLQLYQQMIDLDIPRTPHVYVQIMQAFNSHRRHSEAMMWYDKMNEDLGETDNPFALHQYLKAASHTASFTKAVSAILEQLDEAATNSTPVNMHILNAVLVGLAKKRKFSSVRRIWHKMVEVDVVPSDHVVNTLIYSFSQSNDVNGALGLLDTLSTKWNVLPSEVHLSTMLQHVAQAGKRDDLPKILQAMGQAGIKPNESSSLTLIRSMAAQNDYTNVEYIMKTLQGSGRASPDFLNKVLQVLIDVITRREGEVEPVFALLNSMEQSGMEFNLASKHRLLRLYIFLGDYRNASRWLEAFLTSDCSVESLMRLFPRPAVYSLAVPHHPEPSLSPTRNRDGTLLSIALFSVCRYPNPFVMPIFRHLMGMYPDFIPTVGDFSYALRAIAAAPTSATLGHLNEILRHMHRRGCPLTHQAKLILLQTIKRLDPSVTQNDQEQCLQDLKLLKQRLYPSDATVLQNGVTITSQDSPQAKDNRDSSWKKVALRLTKSISKYPCPPRTSTRKV